MSYETNYGSDLLTVINNVQLPKPVETDEELETVSVRSLHSHLDYEPQVFFF